MGFEWMIVVVIGIPVDSCVAAAAVVCLAWNVEES